MSDHRFATVFECSRLVLDHGNKIRVVDEKGFIGSPSKTWKENDRF